MDFFTHMEMYMRQEKPTLCGRDHISYRSYYLPAKVRTLLQSRMEDNPHFLSHTHIVGKLRVSFSFLFFTSRENFHFPRGVPLSFLCRLQDVIDGDLCEQFSSLPYEKQKLVAAGLDRTVGEVVKKLEDTRNKLL